ncbi:putative xylanase/chitin deacetylase [Aspergillus avenaceus]|uniref:Putative xylanase/chitin deacetylase n=1 Tax=Aspergillus avenaceus TaxID=36643 RepID=A0A5N6TFW7_ASPAV|nr:putative xylanase/chitin deacetylase [Aspergillus avenaceus]
MMALPCSLGLEGLHVFIITAASGTGRQAVREFLDQGCKVTALSLQPLVLPDVAESRSRLYSLSGDVTDEECIQSSFAEAGQHFGPINILIANAGLTAEDSNCPIWELPLETWETYHVNSRGTFLTIKHFLRAAQASQQTLGKELENMAIVLTGRETSKLSAENVSGNGFPYDLIRRVKGEIVRLNSNARINAVTHGCIEASRASLESPAKQVSVARTISFLASHHAAGHISGQCFSLDGGLEGRSIKENYGMDISKARDIQTHSRTIQSIPMPLTQPKANKVRIAVSIDLDAVSGWLGTGQHPDNILADYSSGFFAAKVGVPRLLRMLKKLGIADRCTWFIPGHSTESFPDEVQQVVASGCEIGLHGYAHEGAYQLTVEQERDVLTRCIEIATNLTGKKPVGYRAPLYQLRESTLDLLEEFGFEYDASLTDHDCHPFFAPKRPPLKPIDFSLPATQTDRRPLVCVPCNWYMEDMTPMQFLPHAPNSHGYTDVRVIENLWKDRFLWIRENEDEPIFPVLMHPDTSGMAHVIGMLERLLTWLQGWDEVEFCQTGEIAKWFRESNK